MINVYKIYDDMCTKIMKRGYILLLTYTMQNVIIGVQKENGAHINELSRKQKNCAVKLPCTSDELEAEQNITEAVQGLHCFNRHIKSAKGQYSYCP